jgi:hypothetical protein
VFYIEKWNSANPSGTWGGKYSIAVAPFFAYLGFSLDYYSLIFTTQAIPCCSNQQIRLISQFHLRQVEKEQKSGKFCSSSLMQLGSGNCPYTRVSELPSPVCTSLYPPCNPVAPPCSGRPIVLFFASCFLVFTHTLRSGLVQCGLMSGLVQCGLMSCASNEAVRQLGLCAITFFKCTLKCMVLEKGV